MIQHGPPTVGMVVPTLGERPDLLAQTLASITGQDGVDLRLVVVTPEARVATLRAAHPGVDVVAEAGGGIAAAIEAGWEAIGPVDAVAWLGDDDLLAPGSLMAASTSLLRDPRASMVYGRCHYIDVDGGLVCEIRPGRVAIPLLRLGRNLIAQPGALYRRTAVEAIGGLDREITLAFDCDLHLRLAKAGRATYLPVVLGAARTHADSLTTAQREASVAQLELVTKRVRGSRVERLRPLWDRPAEQAKRLASKLSTRRPH